MSIIKRNILIFGLAAVLIAAGVWFFSAGGFYKTRQPEKTFKIGILYKGANFKNVVDGFIAEFDGAYKKDRKIEYVIKEVAGAEQKDFDAAADDLVRAKVDLIVAPAIEAVKAAVKATAENKIPIILELGINPINLDFVKNFQKPGGNVTGVSWQVDELTGKRLEFLKMVAPKVKHITIFRQRNTKTMEAPLKYLKPVAENLGVKYAVKEFSDLEELKKLVSSARAADTDAFFYGSDPFFSRNIDLIIKQGLAEKLPTMVHDAMWARKGALAAYGGNFNAAGRQGARQAAKILFDGLSPSDVPVETVSKIDIVINLKTAKEIGLTIPESVLSQATEIVRE